MKIIMLDASGFLFRHFYACPPVQRSDGVPVNAIKAYCEMLWGMLRRGDYTHIVNIEDGGRSGRELIDSSYKANRPDKPDDLRVQLKMLPDATASFGVPSLKIDGYEADDVIASLATQALAEGYEVEIHSGDKDLLQLIEPGISIYDPLKKQIVTPEVCRQRFGVLPEQMICYQSLVGDSSDNVKGVPSVGAKTAATLLQTYGDLDTIINTVNLDPESFAGTRRIAQNILTFQDVALTARKLVTLQRDVYPLPDVDSYSREQPDPTRLSVFLREMEFNLLAQDVTEHLGIAA